MLSERRKTRVYKITEKGKDTLRILLNTTLEILNDLVSWNLTLLSIKDPNDDASEFVRYEVFEVSYYNSYSELHSEPE